MYSKTLNKEFQNSKLMFAELKANKQEILQLKKSETKRSDPFGLLDFERQLSKAYFLTTTKAISDSKIQKTIIGNTYNWMDQHEDVHIDGIFTKSIKENSRKVLHLHDHVQEVAAKVGIPISIYEKKINWSELNVDKVGQTTSLMMDSNIIKDLNPAIFYQYQNNEIDQHSVGMIYVSLSMCINSEDPEYKEEYADWAKYIGRLGNPNTAIKNGYFFAVTEAKLREISAVTDGSNELTGMYNDTSNQPEEATDEEPSTTKSKVICQNCNTIFDHKGTGSDKCPGCGQYASANSTTVEMPVFDWMAAIQQTQFI